MSKYRVPMSRPDIGAAERRAVAEVLEGPRLSMGEHTRNFEDAIKAVSGSRRAIAVSSGTTGLHLCVRAAGIGPGDLVITTPFSFVASSNVLLYERAAPVFVDVEPDSGNIDVERLAEAAADLQAGGDRARQRLPRRGVIEAGSLKAILAVDVFGQPADYDAIRKVADEYGLALIEDSCEAIGAQYQGRPAGSLGDMGVFAFYPNKQMTTGEGGVIVTDDGPAADFMRALRNQGRAEGDTWLDHEHLGYNYRITEMSAVLGSAQVERLEELLAKRNQVATWYNARLEDVQGVVRPTILPTTTRMSWFLYVARVAEGLDRDAAIRQLDEAGIPSRAYFKPIHLQKYMQAMFGYEVGDYPVAEDLGRRGLALPFSSIMQEAEVELVVQALKEALGKQ